DNPRPAQDRPHRLPMADPPVHRPDVEFLFVPADQVLDIAAREGGHSFDTKGATYTHRRTPDGERCTFEVLIDEHHLGDDPPLARLLAATPAEIHLDHSPPRPIAAAEDADVIVAIDCDLPGAEQWTLTAEEPSEATRDELRNRVTALVRALTAADVSLG